jgi:hypothetical protein
MDPHAPAGLYRPDAESKEKADGLPDLLKKPVNALAIVPQSRRITPLFRKTYNVMLHLAQDQGLEHDVYRAPMSAVVRGLDFDSNDTALIKKHLRAMASTIVEWQSPTSGEGSSWAVSGLIGHAELRKERGQIWLEWSYSVKLRQELLRPSVFAKLSIEIIAQLQSHGAIALYEICSRYRDVGQTSRQSWSWWRPVLSGKPETEQTRKQEYRFFKRDVLKAAMAEVNAVTDLSVQLVEYKAGRFISDLQFKIERKVQQEGLPAGPVEPLDLSLLSKARSLGIDERSSEQLLDQFGDALMRVGLDLLEKRITSAYPEPLREPGRYLQTVLAAERRRAAPTSESIRSSSDAVAAAPSRQNPQTSAPSKIVEMKRQARWHEEWLRRRRERVVADLNALSQEEQGRLTQALLSDMETRRVHPSIRKRLQVNGWQHPMVLQEMVRLFAVSCIGDGWDKPTPQQLLEIATQMGDG